MRKVIFLTRSISYETIAAREITTSSQAYEVGVVEHLATKVSVSIVNLSSLGKKRRVKERRVINNGVCSVEYFEFGVLHAYRIKNLHSLIKEIAGGASCVVLTSGYYPWEMISLLMLKCKCLGVYSIVFDTHRLSTERMPLLKKWLANFYFEAGFYCLRFLDGIVVLNPRFIKHRGLNINFLKSRVGIKVDRSTSVSKERLAPVPRAYARPMVIFAGTINADNGVQLVLDCMSRNPVLNVEVWFYGNGELVDDVIYASGLDSRVKYGGILSDAALDERIRDFDFSLCLRDPRSVTAYYAFPSKLIKFVASDVKVISNDFCGLGDEYKVYLLMLDSYSIEAIEEVFINIGAGLLDRVKSTGGKDFVENNNDWAKIVDEMLRFFFCKRKDR